MRFLILSRRHNEGRYSSCDACGKSATVIQGLARLVVRNGDAITAELRICAPCALEAARIATPPRTA